MTRLEIWFPGWSKRFPPGENGGVAEDLTSITWKLKEGIVWSDGTPLTADDVVFSGEYCLDPDMGCNALSAFADVESVEALDDLTVKINFSRPKPFPYGPFVGGTAPIIQKAQFENCMGAAAQECTEQNFYPIGTGPFVVTEFRANDTVLLEANELFRDPNKPFFSEVIFKGGGDAASAARAVLETGEADYAWNLQVEPEILRAMEAAGKGKVVTGFGNAVERLIVNFTNPDPALGDNRSVWIDEDGDGVNDNPHPFLSDYNVRRALSLAIDRNVIVQVGYGEAGIPGCNVLPAPAIYVSTANDECLIQNVDEANRLLDEAGWVARCRWHSREGWRPLEHPVPNLHQLCSPGHASPRQADVGGHWCRDRTAQYRFGCLLRWRSCQPGYLRQILCRHRDVHQHLRRHRPRSLHGQLAM